MLYFRESLYSILYEMNGKFLPKLLVKALSVTLAACLVLVLTWLIMQRIGRKYVAKKEEHLWSSSIDVLKNRIYRHMNIGRKRFKLAVQCDIIDSGPGIDPNMMTQIFYPMITGRAEGTGLGLSIAQALITQHNGLIECTSQPGRTVFSVFLPMGVAHD